MNNKNIIYAAYGSNLHLVQMKYRCPYATVIGNGTLPDYRLLFRGCDGNAVATVEPKKGSNVPVLLWEITPRDEEALDHYEGWPSFYRKETLAVKHGEKLVEAMVYVMNDGRPLGKPSGYYLDVIAEGYDSAGFDRSALKRAVRQSGGHRRHGEADAEDTEAPITETLVEQILAVRASGAVNMLDANGVQRAANDRDFYELVIFIEEHRDAYARFILSGKVK